MFALIHYATFKGSSKQTGITYAYENKAYWDKEKQQSRAKRTLIGKVDSKTGKIVPTRPYKKTGKTNTMHAEPGPMPITEYKRSFYGATYLFDQIGQITGITNDLKSCFPDSYNQILSIAYYLILAENNALSRFTHWQKLHIYPNREDIPSQRSSELFQLIN